MSYIVGLCGTHGTGKSTILQGVKAAGYNVIETSLSREAQKQLGWSTLSEAEKSEENMWMLQECIRFAMFNRDMAINRSKVVTLVERTPADVWAYTAMWCKRLDIDPFDNWHAKMYRARCQAMAREYAVFLQVPVAEEIPFVAEPNRADLPSRIFVGLTIDNFIWTGAWPSIKVRAVTPEARIAEAISAMQNVRT
jgi:AAA domain-containing protein